MAWLGAKEFDPALADFEQAVRVAPDDEDAYYWRGQALLAMNRPEAAIQDFNEAIRLCHTCGVAFLHRGMAYGRLGQADLQMADYNSAIRLLPNYPLAYYSRGHAQAERRNFEQALADYSKAIDLSDTYGDAYFSRYVTRLNLGQTEAAEQDAQTALKVKGWNDPLSPYLAIISHLARQRAGDTQGAKDLLEQAAARCHPTEWPAPIIRCLRGEMTAGELLDLATDTDMMTEARAYLGVALALHGKREEALAQLEWVKENGNQKFTEYPLALAEISRLKGTP
jgi:tetratricopeptide (TPR) repeat protein